MSWRHGLAFAVSGSKTDVEETAGISSQQYNDPLSSFILKHVSRKMWTRRKSFAWKVSAQKPERDFLCKSSRLAGSQAAVILSCSWQPRGAECFLGATEKWWSRGPSLRNVIIPWEAQGKSVHVACGRRVSSLTGSPHLSVTFILQPPIIKWVTPGSIDSLYIKSHLSLKHSEYVWPRGWGEEMFDCKDFRGCFPCSQVHRWAL